MFLVKKTNMVNTQKINKMPTTNMDKFANSCTRIPVMKLKSNKSKGCFCTEIILIKIKTYFRQN